MARHRERHRTQRSSWLRAAVLGANDGIVSTASLIVGVAASGATASTVLTAGVAGLFAGAMSMAAGEYVSVSSQADSEHADLERERKELAADSDYERRELASIYMGRGVQPALAEQVAAQMMAHDALGAHARDELGISELSKAQPVQAACASAVSFATGAAVPLIAVLLAPVSSLAQVVGIVSILTLGALGALAGKVGGASSIRGAARVVFWGAAAMLVTAAVGSIFGIASP